MPRTCHRLLCLCLAGLAGCATPPNPVSVRPVADDLPTYTAVAGGVSGHLVVHGGGTMGRLIEPLLTEYTKTYPAVLAETKLYGSSNVPRDLGGTCNVGVMSRRMTDDERAAVARRLGAPPQEIVLAHDALLVLVNAANPIKGFTLAQLDALYGTDRYRHYAGSVVTWGDLGLTGDWANRQVATYGLLEQGQGTVESFRKMVLMGGPINQAINNIPYPENEFGQDVVANAAGVSYNVYHAPVGGARAVPVSGESDAAFVTATPANIASAKYPLSRDLYLYVGGGDLTPDVREFVRYCLSRQGQDVVANHSAVAITTEQAKDQLARLSAPRPTAATVPGGS